MDILHLYEADFYAWTQEQIGLLKTHQWERLDAANLIEEIETLGRKERQELRKRLGILYCTRISLNWLGLKEGTYKNEYLPALRER